MSNVVSITIDELPTPAIPTLKPGQLWQWDFDFNSDEGPKGWWPVTRVTTEGRHNLSSAIVTLQYGDVLTLVTPDDEGPYELPNFEDGVLQPRHRWHVFLHKDVLVWIRHDWMDECKLVQDVE